MFKSMGSDTIDLTSRVWTPGSLASGLRLRLLSYNIHVGVHPGRHYGDYLMRVWRHALPGRGMNLNLDRIAELMQDYDFVAVQEADAGSLRTRFLNQMEYLAKRGGFPHFEFSVTRDLRPVAQHAIGFLSRFAPARVETHLLPSRIPGRRAMRVTLGPDAGGLTLLVAHLSLTPKARQHQLEVLSGLLPITTPSVLLGDLNCGTAILRSHPGLQRLKLLVPEAAPLTFPSWRPRHSLDHILVSPGIEVHRLEALPHAISDHLPLAAHIGLPPAP